MAKGFLHLHVTVVILFTLLYAVKVYFLLSNKKPGLDKLRSKTKIADMVLGSLILITGIYLIVISPVVELYLIIKIVLVIASIPIGIIAMKKANKPMAIAALFIYVYVFAVAKTDSIVLKKEAYITPISSDSSDTDSLQEGMIIYKSQCAVCHGADGTLMLNGAANLATSKATKAEAIQQIKVGKGLMPGFQDQLTEHQVQAVAAYAETLKNN